MTNYPKIVFRYSKVYDGILEMMLTGKKFKYPSKETERKIFDYIRDLEKLWRKDEKKVFKEISKITKLFWKEEIIYCYVIRKGNFSLSDPLTLVVYNRKGFLIEKDSLIDILVHELIHRIFFTSRENFQKSKKAWDCIYRKYKKETEKTKNHIIIHAIHKHLYLKLFNEKRLKRDIQWASSYKDYKRAWQIVEKEGYQNIIKEFQKRIK